jgi:hypothetical protein
MMVDIRRLQIVSVQIGVGYVGMVIGREVGQRRGAIAGIRGVREPADYYRAVRVAMGDIAHRDLTPCYAVCRSRGGVPAQEGKVALVVLAAPCAGAAILSRKLANPNPIARVAIVAGLFGTGGVFKVRLVRAWWTRVS